MRRKEQHRADAASKKKKRIIVLAVVAAILLATVIWTAWGNTALELSTYVITSERLPGAFDGYRIAQISDLHNAQFGDENERLLAMLREAQPDMIAVTGDLIDSRNTDIGVALRFAEEAVKIAPCYYVTGNHESRIPAFDELENGLVELGVVVLRDGRIELEASGESITLLGVDDPSFQPNGPLLDSVSVMQNKLQVLMAGNENFTVLLSHRPELFEVYAEKNIDLILSGHAHGGQFRLPFVGGLVAPNQGFFPEYDGGQYVSGSTNMLVSRGLGNSLFPFRFNNRPEVVLIELMQEHG